MNAKANIREEVSSRIRKVSKTWYKLNEYWKAANASKKWKIIVFDAVIKSKLLYVLETAELTRSLMNKIDAFQIRGLRRILKMQHPYHDRTATKLEVQENCNIEAYRKGSPQTVAKNANRYIQKNADMYIKQKKKLLGHILRAEDSDPFRQVSFRSGTAREIEADKRRVGKPRVSWQSSAKKIVWKACRGEAPKLSSKYSFRIGSHKGNHRQDIFMFEWAENRKY